MSSKAARKAIATAAAALALGLWAADEAGAQKSRSRSVTPEEQLAFGVDMAKRGLWSEALFRFKRASQLRPGDPSILNNVAVAYEAVGDFDRALEAYKRALKADPGNRELKQNYSRFVEFYQSFRPPEAAEQAADESSGEDADSPDPSRS